MNDVEALFEQLVARFAEDPSVELPSATGEGKFGASALKVDGKIFAMLAGEELVVKLPRQRVDELVVSGVGRAFDPGHGRVMKEWITVAPDRRRWDELADEARQFATANAKASKTG